MQLPTFIKANFLAGLLGSVIFVPIAFVYELVTTGPTSLKSGLIDLFMFVMFPLLTGVTFAATALLAFPLVRQLERRGVVSFNEE